MMDRRAQQVWIEQWRGATVALAEQHRRELTDLTSDQALAASEALLDCVAFLPIGPDRLATSGLVHQQALFHRRASP